jgi:hypothetical protein
MLSKKRKLISLIIIVILTFIIGMRYEIDYRVLTRKTVKYLANYELGFYGGKGLRIFETEIAFILTLIPIGFYFTSRNVNSLTKIIGQILIYLILIPAFYFLICYLESRFIKITITNPIMDDGVLKYHQNNVNYRMILFLTIISTFISGIIIKKITNKKKPVANTVYN